MGNRPQTLYGIEDSPIGLASWILDHEQLDRRADPLLILRRQLAEGKISEEEYLERESALRLTERRRR